MPVNFYPFKPIELLEQFITKEDGSPLMGEIEVYRKLFTELNESSQHWHIWHDLKLPFHSDRSNPYRKTSAQIDFLILCEEGILILEVKGGSISFRDNTFYYGNNYENQVSQNPFSQAEGYKYTIKDNILNTGSKYLICHAVVLPHCSSEFNSKIIEQAILWTNASSSLYGHSISNFIKCVFSYNREKHKKYHRSFPKLSENGISEVKRILSPIVNDLNRYYFSDTMEWLNVSNLEILDSLSKNDRIMIEGGPGTGKTTLAKAYIDKQLTKRGLYLCWNSFLMHKMQYELNTRGNLKTCEVYTLSRFLLKLNSKIDSKHLLTLNESGYYELIKLTIQSLKRTNTLPQYDYLVLDEGQDVLDRGADLLINELLGENTSGLSNGKALLLYDIDQSYFTEGRDITEISELLSIYFSHFKLNEVKRSAQYPDIKSLALKALENPESLSFTAFQNISSPRIAIHYFDSLEEIKDYIIKNILTLIRSKNSSLKGSQCIVLVESKLLKPKYLNEPGMHFYLEVKDIEELTVDNINDNSNKLKHTSIIKFKGLEKENVILVVSDPCQDNKYELYVGITRAMSNLEVLIIKR